jgi:hypothetical protein
MCFALLFGDRARSPEAVKRARVDPNLSLLAVDGAVLGTIERDWHAKEKSEEPLNGFAVRTGAMPERTEAPAARCKFLLGDFRAFGEFLGQELANRSEGERGAKHEP